jgi:hypothetical protein
MTGGSMKQFRRWLSRKVAPVPVIDLPFPGEDVVYVVYQSKGVMVTIKADKFRMRISQRLGSMVDPESWEYLPSKQRVRFVGTAER